MREGLVRYSNAATNIISYLGKLRYIVGIHSESGKGGFKKGCQYLDPASNRDNPAFPARLFRAKPTKKMYYKYSSSTVV